MPPAGRLAPFLGRPVLLLGLTREGQWKGSGRAGSVRFDLERALSECAGMLSAYGGHGAAAGFTLAAGGPYAVHDFALAFEATAARQLPSEEDRTARQRIDLEAISRTTRTGSCTCSWRRSGRGTTDRSSWFGAPA